MNINSNSQIKKSALISYMGILFNVIAGLLYTPWMVKQIGQSDYGLYALVFTFLIYFTMDFGLGQAIARFLAKYRAEKEEEKVNQLLGITTKLYLWISGGVMVALLVVYFFIENIFLELNPLEIEKFRTIYVIAGLFSFISFPFTPLNSILIAYERFVVLKLYDIISKITVIVFMVIALFLGYKLYAIVAINALMGLVLILIKIFYLHKTTSIKVDFKYKNKELTKELFGFSAWMTVIGIAQRLMINIAPTLLGIYSGTTAIAVFSIGMLVESYVWTFASALNGLFLPKVAGLTSASSNREEVLQLMVKVGRIQLFVIGILFIGIFTLGREFIVLWMGVSFASAYPIIILLIFPGFFILTQEIASTLLYVENEIKFKAILFVAASIVSILISVFLIPLFGALGAAIGIGVSLFVFEVVGMNIVYYKVMKLNILYFFTESFLKMAPALLLSLLSGFLINYYFPADNFLVFFIKASAIGILYLTLMWLIGLNKFEKDLFESLLLKVILKKNI
jgi:O-antigen/teichoic acid export membrane protein